MPELPEVETVVQSIRHKLIGNEFEKIDLRWPKVLFNFSKSLSVLTSGTFELKFPCPIDADAKIKLFIDLKNLDENLIAIDIDKNKSNDTITT